MPEDRVPVLDQINLVVGDMDATVAFYRRLGVRIPDVPATWAQHHRSATTAGGSDLDLDAQGFANVWNQGWPQGKVGAVVGFRVADRETVDRTYARLTGDGYVGQQPPYDAFWGARYAVVEDPDGNAVGLMSPADPTRRTAPPDPPS